MKHLDILKKHYIEKTLNIKGSQREVDLILDYIVIGHYSENKSNDLCAILKQLYDEFSIKQKEGLADIKANIRIKYFIGKSEKELSYELSEKNLEQAEKIIKNEKILILSNPGLFSCKKESAWEDVLCK